MMNTHSLQSKKKIVVVILIITLVVLGFSILWLLSSKKLSKALPSDTVLTNVQSIVVVRDKEGKANSLFYFTGSNVAKLEASNINNSASKSILAEYPYTNVERSLYNPNPSSLLVQVDPGYLDTMPGMSTNKNNEEQLTAWILQTKESQPKLLDIGRPILDADFVGDNLALITYTENTNQLVIYNPKDKKSKTIISSTDSNKIIGTYRDSVYTRNSSGLVQITDLSSKKTSTVKIKTKLYLDDSTGSLISGEGKTLQILNNDSRYSLKLSYSNYFVTNGYIIETDSITRPTKIRGYNLDKKVWSFSYGIDNEENNNKENIDSISMLNFDPLKLLFVTENQTGYMVSNDSKYIKSFSSFQFPEQKTIEKNDFIYDFDIGSNTAIIISNKDIEATLPIINGYCKCNPNSIKKDWRIKYDNNSEDEFTGNELSPEERGGL